MAKQTRGIGIEFISVLGMPPVQFVALAADLGCQHVGMAPAPMQTSPYNFPGWSLRDDMGLRRELIAALRDRGVSVSVGEGFLLRPDVDIANTAADMDMLCELGAPVVNACSLEPDQKRGFDQCAIFAEMAAARGIKATVEFVPGLPIGDLPTAFAALRHVGKPNFGLLIDAMHVFRSGLKVADVAAIDPKLIGYMQLCDVPLVSKASSYGYEALYERLPPGKGELPLFEFLAALPGNLCVGLEVPMLEQAKAGVSPHTYLSESVDATRKLLARLDA